MQLWQYCLLVTARSLYMFLTLFASIIRSTAVGNWPWTSLLDIHHPDPWHAPVAATTVFSRARAELDGTRAETRFRLSPKRTSPFKSAGESVQSTAGSRGVRISVSNAGYTTSRGRVRVLATHSIRQFPLHFPSRASPCVTTFRTQYTR